MTKTYAQIAREIAALQATASKLYAVEIKSAVAKVNELIAKYGLSADDLKFGSAPAASKPSASAPIAKTAKAAPAAAASGAKYSDGQGRVWGGRGPRPAWLRSAIAAGRSLESFLAAGAADVVAALTRSVSGSAKKSPARKPVATGVAKFVNPKTGAGWSGRGPRPQWLKDALKKRGSKIEDFLGNKPVSTTETAAVAPAAPAPAPASAKKVVVKKAVAPAKKAAAKKAVAKKAVAKKVSAVAAPAAPAAPVAPAKKASAKVASRKAVKAPAKKAAVSKVASKKAPAKKAPAKKSPVSGTDSAAPAAAAPAGDTPAPLASA